MLKKTLLIFVVSLLLGMAITPLRGGYITLIGLTGLPSATLVGGITFFLLTLYFLKRFGGYIKPGYIISIMIVGCCIFELYDYIVNFSLTLRTLPDLISRWVAIIFGYIYYKVNRKSVKVATIVVSLALFTWFSYIGYEMFLRKISYEPINNEVEELAFRDLKLRDTDDNYISVEQFPEDYILLNFWFSYCGVCFDEFPKVQDTYEQYAQSDKVAVYAVHCRMEKKNETRATGAEILRESGYSFPCLSVDIDDPALKKMGITVFPTVIIIDPGRRMIFRDDIVLAAKYLNKLIVQ